MDAGFIFELSWLAAWLEANLPKMTIHSLQLCMSLFDFAQYLYSVWNPHTLWSKSLFCSLFDWIICCEHS